MFLWFKALHLIFMVAWFAGLFYLPRLFVYHALTKDEETIKCLTVMERKLLWGIMTPTAVLTLIFGFAMIVEVGWATYKAQWWLHTKLFLVALLLGYHFWCIKLVQAFKHKQNKHSHVWYRWFNELTLVFLIAIVLLAVFKPS